MGIDVVSVSSKGQVVLPAAMRRSLSIDEGDKLAVYYTDGLIMLKPIKMPSEQEFLQTLDEAKEWAASVGYSESDINVIIKEHRQRKRS